MKASGAPEKIYVHIKYKPCEITFSEVIEKECINIEYTRTDAFIEKAKKWIEEHERLYEAFEPDSRTYYTDIETMVKDFENYMEGE